MGCTRIIPGRGCSSPFSSIPLIRCTRARATCPADRSRLPELKAMAPAYYDGLHAHYSWTRLLFAFLFNPAYSLHTRSGNMPGRSEPAAGTEGDGARLLRWAARALFLDEAALRLSLQSRLFAAHALGQHAR